MYEVRLKALRQFFPDLDDSRFFLVNLETEIPQRLLDRTDLECYNLLLKSKTSNLKSNDYKFISSCLDKVSPYFASYLCLRFKTKVCDKERMLFYIGQIDNQKDYLSFYSSYIALLGITKKDCDDQEAYQLYYNVFTKRSKLRADYLEVSYYCLKNNLHPVIMESFIRKIGNVDQIHLNHYLQTFCIFHYGKEIEKAFNLDAPKWKINFKYIKRSLQ